MRQSSYSFNSTTSSINNSEPLKKPITMHKPLLTKQQRDLLFKPIKNNKNVEKDLLNFKVFEDNEDIPYEEEAEIPEENKDTQLDQHTKQILDQEFILELTGYLHLSEVDQIILRQKNLLYIDNTPTLDLSLLCNLEFFCASHNQITNISGIKDIPNSTLIEINLEYNKIKSIDAFLHHTQLEKLFLSGNLLKSIKNIQKLQKLTTLTLTKNKLDNFEETLSTLSQLQALKILDLEQNPISRAYSYKYDILWVLKLDKLDGEEISQTDKDLCIVFQKQNNENRNGFYEQNGYKRPCSANFKDRFRKKIGDLVQQSQELLAIPEDRHFELENEADFEKKELLALQEESERVYLGNMELEKKLKAIQEENEEINGYIQENLEAKRENVKLKKKLERYLNLMERENKQTGLIKEIYMLNLQIMELEKQNKSNMNNKEIFKDEEEVFQDNIGLDIGFESEELDEEMKQIKKILNENGDNINQIKQELANI